MLIMQIRLFCGLQKLVKRLPWGEKTGYRHQKHRYWWFCRKVRTLYIFSASLMLIYANEVALRSSKVSETTSMV